MVWDFGPHLGLNRESGTVLSAGSSVRSSSVGLREPVHLVRWAGRPSAVSQQAPIQNAQH
jgi:hypothetical protein